MEKDTHLLHKGQDYNLYEQFCYDWSLVVLYKAQLFDPTHYYILLFSCGI